MKSRSLIESFTYAIRGLLHALQSERNLRIHVAFGLLVFLLGIVLGLPRTEIALLAVVVALVICLELVNTAIEAVIDRIGLERHPLSEVAKNVAAGAVFVGAVIAVIVGYLLFFERIADLHAGALARATILPAYVPLVGICIIITITLLLKAFKPPFRLQGGMPSGHAAVAFGLAVAILFLSSEGTPVVLAGLLALLVAQSRVEGGIHSVIEVVLGAALGALVMLTVFASLP